MSIDTRSGQIQVQGEYEVSIEAEPEILQEQSFDDRHAAEIQKIINPMADEEFKKDYDPEEESPIEVLQKKRGRPPKHIEPDIEEKDGKGENVFNGKTIRVWYHLWKRAGSPTPVVDFTRTNKIPYQPFMDTKREIEKE